MEDTFIKIGKGENQGCLTEKIYKLDPMKKNLIDNFMQVRENMLLMAKSNVDANGKATIADRYNQRPITIGEGMIPQIERFASKASVNNFTINTFQNVITQMARVAESATGNHFAFICNLPGWDAVQRVLGNYLANRATDGAYLWSRGGNTGNSKYVKVGATFDSYEWGGNIISFKHDDTLTREYSEPYFLCIDLTTGKTSTQPPVAMFTLEGADFVLNEIHGVGGATGKQSGIVSSPVAGGSMIASGWAGIAVFNPYRSFILRGQK